MATVHREAIQKQIQQDWANREYIEVITGSIKKITDFLNSFGKLCHYNICKLVIIIIIFMYKRLQKLPSLLCLQPNFSILFEFLYMSL